MRSGIRRCLCVAFVALGLLLVRTTSASAQTDRAANPTRIKVDISKSVDALADADGRLAIFAPKVRARFQPPGQTPPPNLGPSADDSGIGFGVDIIFVKNTFKLDETLNLDDESRSGIGGGFWVGGNRNGNVGFTGEFNFIVVNGDEGEGSLKLLEIPAVFHINFGSRSRNSVGGYVVVGPAFTFKLNDFTGGFGEDNFKGVDIGIIGGLGVEFFRFGIEGRGNWGMTNISESGDTLDIKTFKFELLGKFAFN